MYNEALIAIEDLCIAIANLSISHFSMSSPNRSESDLLNTDMNRELCFWMHQVELAKCFLFHCFLPRYNQKMASHWPLHLLALQQIYKIEAEQLIQHLSCH